jgi:outer membrane murein-binding lipoprotein Lpp
MSARIALRPRCWWSAAVVLGALGVTGCGDQAKIKELQEKVAALEAEVKELQEKQTAVIEFSRPDKDEEYVASVATAYLNALMAADKGSLRGKLTANLRKSLNDDGMAVDRWIDNFNANKSVYGSCTIEKIVLSPDKDQFIVQGTLNPVYAAMGTPKGSISLVLVKDKGPNKFLIDAASGKP